MFYIVNLTFYSLIRILFLSLYHDTKYNYKGNIFYFDSSIFGKYIAVFINYLFPQKFEKLDFKFENIREKNGQLSYIKIIYKDLAEIYENISVGKVNDKNISLFLKRCIIGDDGDPHNIVRRLFIIKVTSTHMNALSFQEGYLLMNTIPRMIDITNYASKYDISIINVGLNTRETLNFLKSYIRIILSIFQNILLKFKLYIKNQYKFQLCSDSPKISVYSIPIKYQIKEFWFQSEIVKDDLMFLLPKSYPYTSRQKDSDIINGANFVDIKKSYYNNMKIENINIKINTNSFFERLIIRSRIKNYCINKFVWKNFFINNNIKVYVTHFKYSNDIFEIRNAINNFGGIFAIFQETKAELSTPLLSVSADLMFGFSSKVAEVERKNGSNINYFISIGYVGDYRFDLVIDKAKNLRAQLRRNGARKIISFFDENSSADERWNFGNSHAIKDYQILLNKVLADNHLGLIIKPKKPSTLRTRLGHLNVLLDQAITTGRCFLFQDDYLITPSQAALASDVAIGDSLWGGTAAMECALAGIPTLVLDREGWCKSQIYHLEDGKVVFYDWQTLWNAITEYWDKKSIPGFGDWSPIINDLDPFRDGKAAQRMTTYLSWLIKGFKQGLDSNIIMADAADRYAKKWGLDKVVYMS